MKQIISFLTICGFLFSFENIKAQVLTEEKTPISITKAFNEQDVMGTKQASIVKNEQPVAIDLPTVKAQYQSLIRRNPFQKATMDKKRTLKPGQSVIFSVENGQVNEDTAHLGITFSSEIEAAIARVPQWIQYDLRFKFFVITNTTTRSKMVSLLNATPKQYLDEVAFTLANLPYEVLSASRFSPDWDYLRTNVEMIYTHADSLKYVRLVESGDTASGDWSTTTEYKIKQGSTYIWRTIDKYYYYQFIVMPKIEQEGMYVSDNNTSITAQRTWGYGWRDYLWNDPDSTYRYHPVNIWGYKIVDAAGNYDTIRIDTVPRLGEIMQMPEYLWNESMTWYMFNRPFTTTQGALDVLGNWASRCVPMDVTSSSDYRPSQPNHIAWKHVGNCHEDALLVVAAARTALIPCIHVGDLCDDHVWAAIHDGAGDPWHHFEFFRGGCSASRAYWWGMTNMQEYGGYGWNSSLVQGYVPNGTLFNLSNYYSENQPACTLDLTITDLDGFPVDGARVNLYSSNTQYSTTYILSAGYLWTDAQGKITLPVGTGKKYYMKIYHPKFGSFPTESTQVYILSSTNTIKGKTYSCTFQFPSAASAQRNNITADTVQYEATNSLKVTLRANNITTGNNALDGQNSSFYDRTNTLAALNAYVVEESQISKFKTGNVSANATYHFGSVSEGDFIFPVHTTGKTYVVLTNNNNYTNYVELDFGVEMSDTVAFNEYLSVEENNTLSDIVLYPNPAQNTIHVLGVENADLQLFDITGKCVKKVSRGNEVILSDLASGIYFIRIRTAHGVATKKFIKQ